MRYIISENRMLRLVEKMIQQVEPEFNEVQSGVATFSDGDDTYLEYYDRHKKLHKNGKPIVFARYYVWRKELVLNPDIFFSLDDYFGEDMTMVIDWFNKEFNQDAESVNY